MPESGTSVAATQILPIEARNKHVRRDGLRVKLLGRLPVGGLCHCTVGLKFTILLYPLFDSVLNCRPGHSLQKCASGLGCNHSTCTKSSSLSLHLCGIGRRVLEGASDGSCSRVIANSNPCQNDTGRRSPGDGKAELAFLGLAAL